MKNKHRRRQNGFTLLELLIATSMFSLLIGSLYAVFFGALRMREKTYQLLDQNYSRYYALSTIKKDIGNIVPSKGVLCGSLVGEKVETKGNRMDTLEFYATSGKVRDSEPWGDIQKISYSLMDPQSIEPVSKENPKNTNEMVLVRSVTKNLLSSETEEPILEKLLDNVASLQISYSDGTTWEDSWDGTTITDQVLQAISFQINFVTDAELEKDVKSTISMTFPILTDQIGIAETSGSASTTPGSSYPLEQTNQEGPGEGGPPLPSSGP